MHGVLRALLALQFVAQPPAAPAAVAADEKFRLELNSAEGTEKGCRLNFVVENKSKSAVESMKLDLVVFGSDGGILRRLLAELGPVRPVKTIVRAFVVDVECRRIGSILVNEVNACSPGNPDTCLDALAMSSRVKEIKLYR
jgi:hypothetical protein